TLTRTPDFESGTFDHSATSPQSNSRHEREGAHDTQPSARAQASGADRALALRREEEVAGLVARELDRRILGNLRDRRVDRGQRERRADLAEQALGLEQAIVVLEHVQ